MHICYRADIIGDDLEDIINSLVFLANQLRARNIDLENVKENDRIAGETYNDCAFICWNSNKDFEDIMELAEEPTPPQVIVGNDFEGEDNVIYMSQG